MVDTLTTALRGGIGSAFDRSNRRILVAESSGRIVAVDLRGNETVLGDGYSKLEDIVVSADGKWALVTEDSGSLLRLELDAADATNAKVVASRLNSPRQIVLLERRRIACVVEAGRPGRLIAVWLPTGRTISVIDGLEQAVGLAIDRNLAAAYVTEQAGTGGRLTAIGLRRRTRRTIASGLIEPYFLSWSDETESALLVPERDPANRLSHLTVRTGRRRVLIDELDPNPSSLIASVDGRIALITARSITLHDVAPQPTTRVELDVGSDPIFLGAYRRVGVKLVGSGVSFGDLQFAVAEGERGGRISYSKDETFSSAGPEIMLLGGHRPGIYTLEARRASNNELLGQEKFEISDLWAGPDGPPLWFEGVSQPAVTGSAWGGGTVGPQNVDLVPATGDRRVAILLVDTASQRFAAANVATVTQEWADETFNGITVGGVTRSCHHYFQEVSQSTFGLDSVGVFGPVQLTGDFEDYFSLADGLWKFRSGFFQSAVTAGDDLINYSDVDSLVVVVRSAPAVDPTSADPTENMARFAWPWATGGTFTTDEGNVSMAVVVMPHDWGDTSNREIHDTLSHELGHNIGLPDLYMDTDAFGGAIATRDIDTWDIMSWDDPLPHLSTPNKMRLGWIRPDWVRAYDFQSSGAIDDTVTLFASELGQPPAGQFSAVEVRLADGWNYYFEYRSEQTAQIGDQQLTQDRRVIGTDVISPSYTAPIVRRQIILLPNDADGDGPILGVGQDYEELDVSDPMFPTDFSVEVISVDDDTAQIRIRYGVNSKPDPSIRPWPGTGTNAYQSPDIEVRNAKNAADATLENIPWTGHSNTIVAKVKNVGSLLAQNVKTKFSVKDFTAGGGTETPLGSDTQDIPVGATVEFTFDGWVPPSGGHFCVVARLPLHVEPGPPTIVEMTELNNLAQSNYSEFISAEASPPARQRTWVTVGNPYPEPTRAHLHPRQTNPFYRTYVGHTSVDLAPGEERSVELMFEALNGTPDADEVFRRYPEFEGEFRRPNHVVVDGYIEDPRDRQLHSLHSMGGVVARVRTGVATRVDADADGDTVFGRVTAADKSVVTTGRVIVAVGDPGDARTERTEVAEVSDGQFAAQFGDNVDGAGVAVTVEYLGHGDWAPSQEIRFVT